MNGMHNKTIVLSRRRIGLLASAAGMFLLGAPAHAENLLQALAQAYTTNPDIQEARAQQRAVDEGVAIARAPGFRLIGGRGGGCAGATHL